MSQKLTVPHPKKKIDKTTLIVLCVIGVVLLIGCIVLGAAFDYALGKDGSIDGSKINPALHYVLSHPAVIFSSITKKGRLCAENAACRCLRDWHLCALQVQRGAETSAPARHGAWLGKVG